MKTPAIITAICATAALCLSIATAADENPIKKAMQLAHKAPKGEKKLCEKIVDGTASDEEVKNTLEAYRAAASSKPPQGDAEAFKQKWTKLLAATESVATKQPGASAAYKTAVNCKACHDDHKAK